MALAGEAAGGWPEGGPPEGPSIGRFPQHLTVACDYSLFSKRGRHILLDFSEKSSIIEYICMGNEGGREEGGGGSQENVSIVSAGGAWGSQIGPF